MREMILVETNWKTVGWARLSWAVSKHATVAVDDLSYLAKFQNAVNDTRPNSP